jgi:hypothetical protein
MELTFALCQVDPRHAASVPPNLARWETSLISMSAIPKEHGSRQLCVIRSSSRNAVSISSARTTKRFPLRRIALESFLIAVRQMIRPVFHVNWLIWSSDHGGWSKPNRHGYTNRLVDAGRYSFDEALEIVQDANSGTFARNFPSETMCPDWTEETPGAKN